MDLLLKDKVIIVTGGAKGIGEAGTIGAGAAVANAVHDALAPWGVHIASQPYTPEKILQALGRVGPRA